MASTLTALLVLLGGFAYALSRRITRSKHPLPPGPFKWPLVGNVLSVATSHPWKQFAQWSRIYGPVIHLQALSYSIVVLNSAEAAFDLLDGRSANYSDRPSLTMISLMDLSWVIPLMPYGDRWRKHRRLLHKFCNTAAVKQYEPLQQRKVLELLVQLRKQPERFVEDSTFAIGTVLLDLTYGPHDKQTTSRYLKYAQDTANTLAQMFLPGTLLVQFVPFLQYLPSWFPGASYKKKMESWQETFDTALNEPFNDVKKDLNDGSLTPSFLTKMLEEISHLRGPDYREQEYVAKSCASVVYGGKQEHLLSPGSDTTIATLITFYLAMVLHPEAQRAAQAELMSVVGAGRLPEFDDRPSLPYINALILECTRWVPVTPLGAFHASMNDDVYNGYCIPKRSIVFANQWAMLHDPVEYPDPEAFKPDRFIWDGKLNPDVRDPNTVAFGFGRRICPGRDISDATIFISVASILHVFDIGPRLDADGRPIWPSMDVTSSTVSRPLPFQCTIRPRSITEHLLDAIDVI